MRGDPGRQRVFVVKRHTKRCGVVSASQNNGVEASAAGSAVNIPFPSPFQDSNTVCETIDACKDLTKDLELGSIWGGGGGSIAPGRVADVT